MTEFRGLGLRFHRAWLRSLLLATGLLIAPASDGQQLTSEMLNVKAWQGKITVKGNASGSITGPAGTESYVLVWDVTADVVLEEQNTTGKYWAGKISGKNSRVSHSLTTVMPDGCRKIDEINGTGDPTGDGGPPVVMLFAGPRDDFSFFTNAILKGIATTRFLGTGVSCGGSFPGIEGPVEFWPDDLDREKRFPLQKGMVLSHTGEYEVPFPLSSINAVLGGARPTPKVTVTMEFKPLVKDEMILEISSTRYNNWIPKAKHSGAPDAEIQPGDPIEFTAELKMKGGGALSEKATHLVWELINVSAEPGVALNWPPNGTGFTEPDLKFDPADHQIAKDEQKQRMETKPGEYTTDKAKVAPFDWGGWGVLKVTAHFASRSPLEGKLQGTEETEILLPKRAKNSYIADAWKSSPDGAPGGDFADSENDPKGDGTEGDGLSLYEEYRGFYENKEHKYANPKKKDYFINNQIGSFALGGIVLFYRQSGLDVHWDLREEELNLDRVINYLKDRGPSNNDQHGVRIVPIESKRPYATAVSTLNDPATPKYITRIEMPTQWRARASTGRGFDSIDSTIAHELLHACNVWHHGQKDVEVSWERDPVSGGLLMQGLAVRLYLESGTEVTMSSNVSMDRWVGELHGEHSGNDTCVMRYSVANTYLRQDREGPDFYSVSEVPGHLLCSSPEGTGVNSPTRPNGLMSRYREASPNRGDCKHQILVNDRAAPPRR